MTKSQKQHGPAEGAALVDLAGGHEATYQNQEAQSNIDAAVLASRSTATAVQLAKIMVLLRQGPKTTMELRDHSILMPAARIFQLKREHGHTITTELLPLFDNQGVRHSKCARYHLIAEAVSGVAT
ncbi:helix-turn-helix domain-containing protein [Massilia sp. CCM 8734]|uniref:helix-turn-helix domain-containing protein n=1 Tax=Massilia sp. CCM 8734 TaxID=2609283 RepID=UPI0014246DB6|nr:helix-turn-helix domain-containing protein [Massilia sp. CCM 8734]NHZ97482.1 hypothetical protein [Massilia sp. CCM 8734]